MHRRPPRQFHDGPIGERWFELGNCTDDPECKSHLSKIVQRNIEAIEKHHLEAESAKTFQDRIADLMTRWSGSMLFVYAHAIWFALWIAINQGWLELMPFDPFPYGLLTTIVSLEAIFLSTFVLVSQNRQAGLADRRAELDLQINMLAEYEMTRVLTLVDAIAKKLDVDDCDRSDLEDLETDVEPGELLNELERRAGSEIKSE